MATEILKSFGTLQSELEQAKTSLKGVDENIKRLIGRDPSEITRQGVKRGPPTEDNRSNSNKRVVLAGGRQQRSAENADEPKRRNGNVSVFKRLSERVPEEETFPQKQMISKVIVTPKEVPSRQEALAAQTSDEKSRARNRRMFGALLGTLQKFQQEEIKLKQKEDKRAQLERKIEEHEIKEKAEIKKERQELFLNRKKKQAEIKMIELKMLRMKEYAAWEEQVKPTMNFIRTKAKPHLFYLPRKMNDTSKELLAGCKADVEKLLDSKRQEVFEELQHIEERMKKNFESRRQTQEDQSKEAVPTKETEEEDEEEKMETDQVESKIENDIENGDTTEKQATVVEETQKEVESSPAKESQESEVQNIDEAQNTSELKSEETNNAMVEEQSKEEEEQRVTSDWE